MDYLEFVKHGGIAGLAIFLLWKLLSQRDAVAEKQFDKLADLQERSITVTEELKTVIEADKNQMNFHHQANAKAIQEVSNKIDELRGFVSAVRHEN